MDLLRAYLVDAPTHPHMLTDLHLRPLGAPVRIVGMVEAQVGDRLKRAILVLHDPGLLAPYVEIFRLMMAAATPADFVVGAQKLGGDLAVDVEITRQITSRVKPGLIAACDYWRAIWTDRGGDPIDRAKINHIEARLGLTQTSSDAIRQRRRRDAAEVCARARRFADAAGGNLPILVAVTAKPVMNVLPVSYNEFTGEFERDAGAVSDPHRPADNPTPWPATTMTHRSPRLLTA